MALSILSGVLLTLYAPLRIFRKCGSILLSTDFWVLRSRDLVPQSFWERGPVFVQVSLQLVSNCIYVRAYITYACVPYCLHMLYIQNCFEQIENRTQSRLRSLPENATSGCRYKQMPENHFPYFPCPTSPTSSLLMFNCSRDYADKRRGKTKLQKKKQLCYYGETAINCCFNYLWVVCPLCFSLSPVVFSLHYSVQEQWNHHGRSCKWVIGTQADCNYVWAMLSSAKIGTASKRSAFTAGFYQVMLYSGYNTTFIQLFVLEFEVWGPARLQKPNKEVVLFYK